MILIEILFFAAMAVIFFGLFIVAVRNLVNGILGVPSKPIPSTDNRLPRWKA